jgi:uncharacterized protein (TIGR03067 family)
VTRPLAPRPNLEHFRGQAKSLLAALRAGDLAAARSFIEHLPTARALSPAAARAAPFRLADAQSVIARSSGFAGWSALIRHVDVLRSLEGEWRFESLETDGVAVPAGMLKRSRLLFDGDRFRMESPEATYDGRFTIDTSTAPMQLDIEFVEGPEAGNTSYGIFMRDREHLTICLGLVGSTRPTAFVTRAGSGHALEHLRRASARRPAGVTGGTAKPRTAKPRARASLVHPAAFAATDTPILRRLEGAWIPVRLVTNGDEMVTEWLPFGSRTSSGNEVKIVFGGQVMLHVKMRIDDGETPIAVDYLHLKGADEGNVSLGIMEWVGDEVRFLMASPGIQRPASFSLPGAHHTLSQWKRQR